MENKEILKQIPITDVVERLGLSLKPVGNSLQGDCITGHESEHHQCFSVNINKNFFNCFHCDVGGDVIELVKLTRKITFTEAMRWLAAEFRPELFSSTKNYMSDKQEKTDYTQAALYEAVFERGKELLHSDVCDVGKDALAYLTDTRQYNIENLKHTDWIYYSTNRQIREYLIKRFPEAKEKIKKNLHLQGYYGDNFRLAFPYRNRRGLITGFVKRALEPKGISIKTYDGKQYENVRWDSTAGLDKYDLFNLCNCRGQKDLIIVEGYPDSLYFHTLGLKNVSAVGQGKLSNTHIEGLKAFGVESVTISFDNDKPNKEGKREGIENTANAIPKLQKANIKVYVVNPKELGEYKDADELFRAQGIEAFTKLVKQAESGHKWLVKHIINKHDTNTEKGSDGACNEALEYVKTLTNPTSAAQCMQILEDAHITIESEIEHIPSALEGEALPDIPPFTDDLLPVEGILRDYINFMSPITEAPVQFHLFASLMMLSTIIGKNIYFITADEKTYCNLWAVLIGRSGCKKSTSIKRPRRILSDIDMKKYIFPTQVTSERLIPMLVENSVGTFFWSEWGATMDQWGKSYAMDTMSIFTELYDGGYFSRWLKTEKYEIDDSCINLFCGCTYSWLKKTMDQGDIAMGFWPRFLFIPAGQRDKYLSIPPKGDVELLEAIKAQLKTMQVIFPESYPLEADFAHAQNIYDKWYIDINKHADSESCSDEIASFTVRLSEYAKKIAILVEASQKKWEIDHNIIIQPSTMEYSIKLCNWLLDTAKYVLGTVQKSELNEIEEKIYQHIRGAGRAGIIHSKLRYSLSTNITKPKFDLAIDSLQDMERIVVVSINTKGKGRPGRKYIAGSLIN